MAKQAYVYGPTFEEMLYPDRIDPNVRRQALAAKKDAPLDPINLFNITWKNEKNQVAYCLMPKELTGVDANIVVMFGRNFPTGSHKVGATYSVAMEKQLRGELTPGEDILVWPSTGNYGIGGSFVGPRMGYQSLVLLPEMMSQERFEKIKYYGADYIKTPGCESNVKEIYDKCHELRRTDPRYKILNQFEVIGNYLFHYYVTGNSAIEVIRDLQKQGIGNGRCAGITSSMGSSGTIGFGDRVKQEFYETRIIGLEPIQCPTMYSNGYGGHDIQGIGDKHVTWIHNCMNMDALMCIDDMECKKGLQLLSDPVGVEYLVKEAHVPEAKAKEMSVLFGISGICNLLGAIKAAKFYQLGAKDTIVTIATDSIDRYYSVMKQLDQEFGAMDEVKAAVRLESIFHQVKEDYVQEATKINRERWFNLKYYTWVEQQGKTVQELNAQKSQDWWLEKQTMIPEIDQLNRQKRGF